MKQCSICNQHKPADAYRGTRSACRECENARRRAWYAAKPVKPHQREEVRAYYRQWYAANAESVKARAVEWTKANPDKRRDVCRENTARQRAKLSNAYVAADNDASGTGQKAAEAANLPYMMPPTVGDDWNDHAARFGIRSVAQALSDSLANALQYEPFQNDSVSVVP